MRIDANGWLSGVRRIVSPNCDARPPGTSVELLVIHNISLPPGQFGGKEIAQLFTNTLRAEDHPYYAQICSLKVSAHFLVRRDGEVVQFVACGRRAWHAGASLWLERPRCNDFSIGIELEGCDDVPFDERQYKALVRLTRLLKRAYPIRAIVGHEEISPGRKADPGPHFDWGRYLNAL